MTLRIGLLWGLLSACATVPTPGATLPSPSASAPSPVSLSGVAEHERGDLDGAISAARGTLTELGRSGLDAPGLRFLVAAWLVEAREIAQAQAEFRRVRDAEGAAADLSRRASRELDRLGAPPLLATSPRPTEATPPESGQGPQTPVDLPTQAHDGIGQDLGLPPQPPEAPTQGPSADPRSLLDRARGQVVSGRILDAARTFELLVGTSLADQAMKERAAAVDSWVQSERERAGKLFVGTKERASPEARRSGAEAVIELLSGLMRDFPTSRWIPKVEENLRAVQRWLGHESP